MSARVTYEDVSERWLGAFRWLGPVGLLLGIVSISGYYAWADAQLAKTEWSESQHRLLVPAGEALSAELNDAARGLLGLADWVALRPNLSNQEFDGYSRRMLSRHPMLRSTTLLPDDRIARTYPMQPALLGFDVGKHPVQGVAVREMIQRGTPVVTGVVQLAQGGRGLVLRAPIWIEGESPRYFGHASVVFDIDNLEARLGRIGRELGLELSLVDADVAGTTAALRLGHARSSGSHDVHAKLEILGEEWLLSGRAGHEPSVTEHWLRLVVSALLALCLAVGLRLLLDAWAALRKQNRLLEALASTDALTGIANRRVLLETSELSFALSKRTAFALSVLMLDLDHFKLVNDRHGHRVGDDVLREFARVTKSCLRATDTLGRWGGEEFLIVAPGTSADGALLLAERLLTAVRALVVHSAGAEIRVTASIGIAALAAGDTNAAGLIERADAALYRAKASGRDRAMVAAAASSETPSGSLETNVLPMRRSKET